MDFCSVSFDRMIDREAHTDSCSLQTIFVLLSAVSMVFCPFITLVQLPIEQNCHCDAVILCNELVLTCLILYLIFPIFCCQKMAPREEALELNML